MISFLTVFFALGDLMNSWLDLAIFENIVSACQVDATLLVSNASSQVSDFSIDRQEPEKFCEKVVSLVRIV